MQLGRSAEELIIVVIIVTAAAADSSESHSINCCFIVAVVTAAAALTVYIAERRAGDIERYSQQEQSRGDYPSGHHYVLALMVICRDRVLSRSRSHIM